MLLRAIHGADGLLVAVGDNGAICHLQGGAPVPVPSPTQAHLHSVFVLHRCCAYAVGAAGTLLHWDGDLWRPMPPVGTDDLWALCLRGPQELFLGGQAHLYHHDGDRVVDKRPVTAPVRALWSHGPGDLWLASGEEVVQLQGHGTLRWRTVLQALCALYGCHLAPDARALWLLGEDSVSCHRLTLAPSLRPRTRSAKSRSAA